MKIILVLFSLFIAHTAHGQVYTALEHQTSLGKENTIAHFAALVHVYFVRKNPLKGQWGIVTYGRFTTRQAGFIAGISKSIPLKHDGFMHFSLGTGLQTSRSPFQGMAGIHAEFHPRNKYRVITYGILERHSSGYWYRAQISRSAGRLFDIGFFGQQNISIGPMVSYRLQHRRDPVALVFWASGGYDPSLRQPGGTVGIRAVFN